MTHDALTEIQAYCSIAGIEDTTFGNLACKDSRFVERLRQGRVTGRTIKRVLAWMQDNPPTSTERRRG